MASATRTLTVGSDEEKYTETGQSGWENTWTSGLLSSFSCHLLGRWCYNTHSVVLFWLIYNKISHLWNMIHTFPLLWHSRLKLSHYDQPYKNQLWHKRHSELSKLHLRALCLTLATKLGRDLTWILQPVGWLQVFKDIIDAPKLSTWLFGGAASSLWWERRRMKLTLLEALKPLQLSDKDGKQSVPPHDGGDGYKY